MNCKHVKIEGSTTKYFVCKIKNKAVDEYECKNCMLRLPNLPNRI